MVLTQIFPPQFEGEGDPEVVEGARRASGALNGRLRLLPLRPRLRQGSGEPTSPVAGGR